MEALLTRLCIGRTRLIHRHLIEQRPAPYCEFCIVLLTVEHIIADCPENYAQRQLCFQNVQSRLTESSGEKPERKIEWPQLFRYLNGIGLK